MTVLAPTSTRERTDSSAQVRSLRAWVRQIRDELLATEDTVCLQRARLVTKAYQAYAADPVPLKRAKAFAHVLRHMDLDLESNPIFAGNTSSRPRAWMLVPEHGFTLPPQVLIENDGLEDMYEGQIPQDMLDYWSDLSVGGTADIGHLAVDLDRVLHEGLEAMIDEARGYDDEPDPDKRATRQAMVTALEAVVAWAQRYADAAEVAAARAEKPMVREAHQRVARACRRVPALPARDLFEGLQAIVLVHLALVIEGHGMSVSIGLPDRVLVPLVGEDLDVGQATGLLAAFMLKVTANSIFGRGSKTQAITVGGADASGRDCSNVLTSCFLSACDLVRVGDPHLFLRWHPGLNRQVLDQAVDMLARGVSMPLLINDGPTAQGFIDAGVAPADAWEYCVIGCNELGIPARSAESATATSGSIQYLAVLDEVLLRDVPSSGIEDMPALLAAMERRMADRLTAGREHGKKGHLWAARWVPTPFTSALMRGCIARGKDFRVGMDYHLPGIYERGLTNAANALAAIDHVVFQQGALTLEALRDALESGLADEALLRRLRAAPKWGNDDPDVDRWGQVLIEMRERVLDGVDRNFGDSTHVVCHVVRSLHRLDGQRIGASADGRLAGTPVADSIGAEAGTSSRGPTAVLNTVCKIDAARYYRGGYNLNLTLPAQSTTPEIVEDLIETFFGRGGQELQINCLDPETLRAAQERPELYGDLVVRFAGFSSRFVDLSRAEQQELIARSEGV